MQIKRRTALLGAVSLLAAVSVAPLVSPPQPLMAQNRVSISGAGASFPAPLYQRWFSEFNKRNPSIQVSYQSVGSGAGVQQFIAGTVDFGASDVGMTQAEIARVSRGVVMVPVTAGGLVLGYNLPGVRQLRLSRAALAAIYLGKVKTWNDPLIARDNPGTNLPNLPISVIRRSDGSGTTGVFTAHLAAISPEWKSGPGVGRSVQWPVGVGGKGNEGVSALISQTRGSIGYIEYSFSKLNKIPAAIYQNKAGKFVPYTPQTASAGLAEIKLDTNLQGNEPDPDGANAYPIISFTWIMAYRQYPDPAKAKAIRDVLNWSLTEGQKFSDDIGYIPLPAGVVTRSKSVVGRIR